MSTETMDHEASDPTMREAANEGRPPAGRIHWSGMTHRGKVRSNNEDVFLGLAMDGQAYHYLGKVGTGRLDVSDYLFLVSDGMGGAQAGEFASRIVVDTVPGIMERVFRAAAAGLDAGLTDHFSDLFSRTHRAIERLAAAYEECRGMGATLTLCWVRPEWLYFAHIGDSRLYYLPGGGGELRQLSNDDTHVGWLRRTGRIGEREARGHPGKNSLQKALGGGHQFVDPQIGTVGLEAGDRFVLCTDGVVDGLWDRQIHRLLAEPDPAEQGLLPAVRLVEAAIENSGRDNTTAVVLEFTGMESGEASDGG